MMVNLRIALTALLLLCPTAVAQEFRGWFSFDAATSPIETGQVVVLRNPVAVAIEIEATDSEKGLVLVALSFGPAALAKQPTQLPPPPPPICILDCFVAGTLCRGPEGSLPIESLHAGDLLLDGQGRQRRVRRLHRGRSAHLVVLNIDGAQIETTRGHLILTPDRGAIPAVTLRAGDQVTTARGSRRIESVRQRDLSHAPAPVFDVELDAQASACDATIQAGSVHIVVGCKTAPLALTKL